MTELFAAMRDYFKECKDSTENDTPKKMKVASVEGLCLELGMTQTEFYAYESGDDSQQAFFEEVLTRYGELCSKYQSLGMMTPQQRQKLDETLFARASREAKTNIQVIFPNWNAPDDWEDYLAVKDYCNYHDIKMRDLVKKLKDGMM